mmetsp:Transcript_30025/g.50488  ORF Transcript_30025/g.50488 Transcript_30025/m.50488 type:complete len:208 (-) Transcript_30025:32-655(-)
MHEALSSVSVCGSKSDRSGTSCTPNEMTCAMAGRPPCTPFHTASVTTSWPGCTKPLKISASRSACPLYSAWLLERVLSGSRILLKIRLFLLGVLQKSRSPPSLTPFSMSLTEEVNIDTLLRWLRLLNMIFVRLRLLNRWPLFGLRIRPEVETLPGVLSLPGVRSMEDLPEILSLEPVLPLDPREGLVRRLVPMLWELCINTPTLGPR